MTETKPQQVKAVKDLIQQYLNNGQLVKLDILSQLFEILKDESDIMGNIEERCHSRLYESDAKVSYALVKQDLAKIIPFDQRSNLSDSTKLLIDFYGLDTMCRHVKHGVELASPEKKEIVGAFLRLYELSGKDLRGAVELTGFLYSCRAAYDVKEETVEKWLVGLGLVNRWYYSSANIHHPAWDIPEWARMAMFEIIQAPQSFRIPLFAPDRISGELAKPEGKELLEWFTKKVSGQRGIIEYPEWEVGKRDYETRYGVGAFDEQFGQLTSVGAISILSDTGRHIHGYFVYLNPDSL